MNDDLDLTMYENADALVHAATTELMELISLNLLDKGACHIALTGGTLGNLFAKDLVEKLKYCKQKLG